MIKGIVFRPVLIGEVPKFEPAVNHPVLADVGLPVRIQFSQHVAVMAQDIIDVALEGEVLGILTIMERSPAGGRTILLVDATGIFISTFWTGSFHNQRFERVAR